MGKSQREKGKRGERELAGKLRDHGYDCRRGQQFCGISGDADVIGLPGIHIECKRVERLNLQEAMEQSKRDTRTRGKALCIPPQGPVRMAGHHEIRRLDPALQRVGGWTADNGRKGKCQDSRSQVLVTFLLMSIFSRIIRSGSCAPGLAITGSRYISIYSARSTKKATTWNGTMILSSSWQQT